MSPYAVPPQNIGKFARAFAVRLLPSLMARKESTIDISGGRSEPGSVVECVFRIIQDLVVKVLSECGQATSFIELQQKSASILDKDLQKINER